MFKLSEFGEDLLDELSDLKFYGKALVPSSFHEITKGEALSFLIEQSQSIVGVS